MLMDLCHISFETLLEFSTISPLTWNSFITCILCSYKQRNNIKQISFLLTSLTALVLEARPSYYQSLELQTLSIDTNYVNLSTFRLPTPQLHFNSTPPTILPFKLHTAPMLHHPPVINMTKDRTTKDLHSFHPPYLAPKRTNQSHPSTPSDSGDSL